MFGKLRRLVTSLLLADIVLTQVALLAADSVRRWVPLGREIDPSTSFVNPYLHLMTLVLWPVVFWVTSVYNIRRDVRPVGDARTLFVAVSTATFAFAGALYFTFRDVPRLLVFYFYLFDLVLLSAARLASGLILRLMHASGRPLTRVLLVGAGESAEAIALALRNRLGHSVDVVGCVDDAATVGPLGVAIVGRLDDMPWLVRGLLVDEVIICLPGDRYADVERLSFQLQAEPVRVRLVPDFLKLVMVQSSVDLVGGVPLIGLREPRIDGSLWAFKRIFDLTVILFGMIVALPLMGVIALAIKLTSAGAI